MTGETGKETGKFGVTIQMHDFWQGGEGIELILSVKKIRDFTVNGEKKEQNNINVTKITIFSIT